MDVPNQGLETSNPDFCEESGRSALSIFMPRIARVVAVGVPHHVTQRGNNRQRIFDSDQDRLLYLKLLREYSARHKLRLWGYCPMDNHIHLVGVPLAGDALARTLRQTHADYARFANVKHRTSGHFWQNRYFSCALDEIYCWTALAYVEKNPVRAGMVTAAGDWGWSSARAHLGEMEAISWLEFITWRQMYTPEQ